MICSNCRHVNPQGSLFCQKCKTPLAAAPVPPAQNDNPFGDFLPTWLSPAPGQPAAVKQTDPLPNVASVAPAPARPTGQTGPLSSIPMEALLKDTTGPALNNSARPAAVEESVNPRPASASNQPAFPNNWASSAPEPAFGLPVPTFQEPPLWFKPPTPPAWQEVASEAHRETPATNGFGHRPTLVGPETREPEPAGGDEPEYGIERGFYYYTDDLGEVNLHALAGFGPRFVGALVDALVTAILGVIFLYIVLLIIVNPSNFLRSATGIYLAGAILPTLFGFLYHTILVGLTSQTLGHRLMGIKVIKRGGRAVGMVSGIVRALYGLVPGLFITLVGLTVTQTTDSDTLMIIAIYLLIYGIAALGLAWALVDKDHQGIHDKLADTYVVSAHRS